MSVEVPPEITKEGFHRVVKLVESARSYVENGSGARRNVPNVEVEIRLQHLTSKSWRQLMAAMEDFEQWDSISELKETVSFFYKNEKGDFMRTERHSSEPGMLSEDVIGYINSLSLGNKRSIYSHLDVSQEVDDINNSFLPQYGFTLGEFSVQYVLSTSSKSSDELPITKTLDMKHLQKEKKDHIIFNVKTCDDFVQTVKMQLSTEMEVKKHHLPELVKTELVRIKHRKTFAFDVWQFDATTVWSADTLENALNKKMENDAEYEFEIELMDAKAYLSKAKHTDDYAAAETILRLIGVLPEDAQIDL